MLPKGAKRVFKGKIFCVYQWRQRMYDNTLKTFEMLTRPDTVEVIALQGKKILIQIQEQPHHRRSFISLPGGRMDPNESPLAAAKRELLEETGYASRDWHIWQRLHPWLKIAWTNHIFIARNCKLVAEQKLDAGEKISIRFITVNEFLALADNARFRSTLLLPLLYRMRLYPKERKAFQKLLFP